MSEGRPGLGMPQAPGLVRRVALLGAGGFVGGAVAAELRRRGVEVRPLEAPRLRWPAELSSGIDALPAAANVALVAQLAERLAGSQVVVNAAGLPDGTAPATAELYGANALLPVLVARASVAAGAIRYVHVSSAAVQGSRPLDETPVTAPFSPYTWAKALGERLVLAEPAGERVLFRATWVHGPGRRHTSSLIRLARSPASCVAGDGSAPTPQVLISDVARSVAALVLEPGSVPPIVLQPANGMTTGQLLRLLGDREPRHIPHRSARAAVGALRGYARLGRHAHAKVRRIEMLLFGRRQVRGWLAERGSVLPLRPGEWQRLTTTDPLRRYASAARNG